MGRSVTAYNSTSERRHLDRLRVLIVEDNSRMASILRSVLGSFGIREVDIARTAIDAIDQIFSARYDFVLLDYELPNMDGLELTKIVRAQADPGQMMIPIILVTAFTERSRVVRARDAGVTEICAKPVSARVLWDRIAEVINSPRPFVRTRSYIGPDRRRLREPRYTGEEKREARYISSEDAA